MHIYLLRFMSKREKSKTPRKRGLLFWIQRPCEISHALFYSITLNFFRLLSQ